MGIEFKESRFGLLTLVLLSILYACAPAPRIYLHYGKDSKQVDLERILAENPLGPAENIKVTTLGQGPGASHHLVQIRDREVPHIHKNHDGTVILMRGKGYLVLDKQRVELAAGDTVHIHRGVVHYFVNTGSEPALAFVVFSPPFDGKDNIPVKLQ